MIDAPVSLEGSWIELSEEALRENLDFLRRLIGSGVTISSVVKGNAYGHGIEAFVPMAERCGISHFSAFGADEAARVAKVAGPDTHIMIMGDVPDAAVPWVVENGMSFYVSDLHRLNLALAAADATGCSARIHLEIETGLHRTGLERANLRRAANKILRAGDRVLVDGVCTHFAGAESISNYVRIQGQMVTFEQRCRMLSELGIEPRIRHTACSAAAINYPESRMDMVRLGIAQYGFWPTTETRMQYLMKRRPNKRTDPLRRVMKWKSRVMSLKRVKQGEFVGYGHSHQAPRNEKLAAIPVGYFHGFARGLSNLGYVLIRGERAPVRGLVNMNMILVDVTDLKGVKPGTEVVIIGRQGDSEISVASFADMTNFLNYEVLVSIPNEIPRLVVSSDSP